jgi:hypothetical protein
MGGGLLQLVAYGAQDVYLTGNPQITFFKVVYRRHTNFAIESIQQTFSGSVGFGQRVTATVSRNGDLISRAYLVLDSDSQILVPYFGLKVIKSAEVEIGGQKIDKHYAEWMYIWNELSMPESKKNGYFEMVGGGGGHRLKNTKLYVPLEFWFCRNIGLALPLIGLQYHEVKITIEFEQESNVIYTADTGDTAIDVLKNKTLNAHLWIDYIYLDTDERRKFAQSSHEYLIEQLQFTGKESAGKKVKLNFNHPVKELIWVVKKNDGNNEDWFDFSYQSEDGSMRNSGDDGKGNAINSVVTQTNIVSATTTNGLSTAVPTAERLSIVNELLSYNMGAMNPVKSGKLILNGNDRFHAREGRYFNLVQPFQHHENVPNNPGINVYSFALKPEEHQPSGTLNMSRIDTAILDLEYEDTANVGENSHQICIYAVNYNVLRILSGMGGIAYSN